MKVPNSRSPFAFLILLYDVMIRWLISSLDYFFCNCWSYLGRKFCTQSLLRFAWWRWPLWRRMWWKRKGRHYKKLKLHFFHLISVFFPISAKVIIFEYLIVPLSWCWLEMVGHIVDTRRKRQAVCPNYLLVLYGHTHHWHIAETTPTCVGNVRWCVQIILLLILYSWTRLWLPLWLEIYCPHAVRYIVDTSL